MFGQKRPLHRPGQSPLCPLSPSWSHRGFPSFAAKCPQNTKERAKRDNPLVTELISLANYE